MLIIDRLSLIGAMGVLLGASPLGDTPPLGTDGHGPPPRSEVAYSFSCDRVDATIRYRQERLDPDSVDTLEQALRVELLELKGTAGAVPPSDFERARALMKTLGWIERVDAVCHQAGVELWLIAMPLQPWVDFIQKKLEKKPELTIQTIEMSPQGRASVE
jgi:hypothetical protein